MPWDSQILARGVPNMYTELSLFRLRLQRKTCNLGLKIYIKRKRKEKNVPQSISLGERFTSLVNLASTGDSGGTNLGLQVI